MITTESFIQVLFSGLLSMLFILILLPLFNKITSLNIANVEIFNAHNILWISAVFLVMIIVTGLVPGIIFSSKLPLQLIKQNTVGKKNFSRNGLLIFQFTVTIALIASILLVDKQTKYLHSQDLGFTKQSIVYAKTNETIEKKQDAFKNELQRIAGVTDYTHSEDVLVENDQNWGRDIENKGDRKNIHFSKLSVAPNFFSFFDIELLEGRPFNELSGEKQEFIFNATAQTQFNLNKIEEARIVTSKPKNGAVIGILQDYNFESLHVPVRPAGFMCSNELDGVIYLKLNGTSESEYKATLQQVESIWNELSPNFPFEYHFLDQKWETHYAKDQQFQTIISYTTLVSIILSCLGLIGLTFFVMEQRTKEIGVRKVNGANISEILTLLNKDFVKWVAIAFVVACPLAYYAMNKWLQNFACKTELSWWIFALAGIISLAIALITVSWQSWRAATRNPVEALKYE